jgi:NADH-quinone oxidoreductase subunit F
MALKRDLILFARIDEPGLTGIDVYRRAYDGYQAVEKVLGGRVAPADVIEQVKASGLRGRGGAGFSTGMKWSFVPKDSPKPRYLVVNADESEPGTFKDRELMTKNPHQMIEGIVLASYAIRAAAAYVYLRGEFAWMLPVIENAIAEAKAAGYLGRNIQGSGYDLECHLHLGAGAYICGEETALLNSLEGKRGTPRLKPPFPAVEGLYACPTVVNNTETICAVPRILLHGPEWYRQWGTEKSAGTKLFSVSGPVRKPGNYEIPLGLPLRALLEEYAGGMKDGYTLKAIIPGGSSVPAMLPEQLDVPLDYESIAAAGSMLGSGGCVFIDDQVCMVDLALNVTKFYRHESCGKCTPCREGTHWMENVLTRIEHGEGRMEQIDELYNIADMILGKSFCALGDAAAMPVMSYIKLFRDEFEFHVREKRCRVNRRRAELAPYREGAPAGAVA